MNMLTFIWVYVLPFLGIGFFILLIAFLLYVFRYMHPVARKLNKFIRKKMAMSFEASDEGVVYIRGLYKSRGPGIAKTDTNSYRILPRIPSKTLIRNKLKEKDENRKEPSDKEIEAFREEVGKRFILERTGCPVFYSYKGKVTVASPNILAAMEQQEESDAKQSHGDEERTIIDPRRWMRDLAPYLFDESQLDALRKEIELSVRTINLRAVLPLIILVVIGIGILFLLQGLGGLVGRFTPH